MKRLSIFCNEIDICTAKCDIFCKDMHMLINGSVFLSRVKSKVFSSMPIEVLQYRLKNNMLFVEASIQQEQNIQYVYDR